MRVQTEQSFRNILDTFSGADGGGKFVFFRSFVIDFDKRAEECDAAAQKIIDIILQFSRMIDVAEK